MATTAHDRLRNMRMVKGVCVENPTPEIRSENMKGILARMPPQSAYRTKTTAERLQEIHKRNGYPITDHTPRMIPCSNYIETRVRRYHPYTSEWTELPMFGVLVIETEPMDLDFDTILETPPERHPLITPMDIPYPDFPVGPIDIIPTSSAIRPRPTSLEVLIRRAEIQSQAAKYQY